MALTRVQARTATSTATSSISATFLSLPTVGNAIVVVSLNSGGATTIADNQGHTYTLVADSASSGRARIWYCPLVTASAGSFTVTGSGTSQSRVLAAIEVSGVGLGLALDQIKIANGTSTTPSTGASPALTGSEVFVAGGLYASATAQTSIVVDGSTPTWTQEVERLSTVASEADTRIVPSATGTTQSIGWTLTTSVPWWAVLAAFKATLPPDARLSQLAVETLSGGLVPARLTQLAVETLQAVAVPVEGRVTQLVVETLALPPGAPVRVTQLAAEVFTERVAPARTTQLALELFLTPSVLARATQVAVEIFLVPAPPGYTLRRNEIRRLRRAPHLTNENRRVFYRRFELDLERGVAPVSGPGSDPKVLLRMSRDGGETWGEEMRLDAGQIGEYTCRAFAQRLGPGRDVVFEVTVSDPIAWSLIGAWLELESGNH